jgi:hypothetical protein
MNTNSLQRRGNLRTLASCHAVSTIRAVPAASGEMVSTLPSQSIHTRTGRVTVVSRGLDQPSAEDVRDAGLEYLPEQKAA